MVTDLRHESVLLREAVEALNIRSSGCYVDATFGRGGHSAAILAALGPGGRLLAIDKDPDAVEHGRERFAGDARFRIERGGFGRLGSILDRAGWRDGILGILLDLGVSSPQLDAPERGFSFLQDGPLDMRMDPAAGPSAAEWLAGAGEREIADVLRELGEERFARRIARAICEARAQAPITRTGRLAEIVAAANPAWETGKHPATRSFQAIRIRVNRELEELAAALEQSLERLATGGRLVVISFHSLEDRMVKRFMRERSRGDDFPRGVPVTADRIKARMRLVGKAVHPGDAELARNPRARSAVLRAAEKTA
ncbi:MAG: 16S rRNA (cytosine(1402)-N(4))-methyltransferase RsmH [Chromatiales bacterium]|jgi:16S rRNA (cytosine1402-N4)-methyltransferase